MPPVFGHVGFTDNKNIFRMRNIVVDFMKKLLGALRRVLRRRRYAMEGCTSVWNVGGFVAVRNQASKEKSVRHHRGSLILTTERFPSSRPSLKNEYRFKLEYANVGSSEATSKNIVEIRLFWRHRRFSLTDLCSPAFLF